MTTHHVSLYHSKTKQPDSNVLKQELITYQQTPSGLKITKLVYNLVYSQGPWIVDHKPGLMRAFICQVWTLLEVRICGR